MKKQYTVSSDVLPKASDLLRLFTQAHWACHRNQDDTEALLQKTDVFVTVRDEGRLIGFGRALSDGVFRALLDDIIVDQGHRNEGVGGIIVKTLMEQLSGIEEIYLNTDPPLESFYGKYAFKTYHGLTMKTERAPAASGHS
jgi:predicted GNAT family N-acyltransferase